MQDEFAFINQIISEFRNYRQETLVPNGDDAAIYKANQGKGQVICIDTLVEEIHFKRSTMSPKQIGYKSLAVNLSDIAAMGGMPTYFLVSLAVPRQGWLESELLELFQGMKLLTEEWNIELLGGDVVTTTGGLVITVTAIGEVDEGVRLLRSNAKLGDLLFVTGYLGQSAAGLDYLLNQEERKTILTSEELEAVVSPLLKAHQLPVPHLLQGALLSRFALEYRLSLNDVSDGLASEAHELAVSSRVNIIIEQEQLPLSPSLSTYAQQTNQNPYTWMLNGGEDFVLVGTLPATILEEVEASFRKQKLPFYVIGHVEEGPGEVWLRERGELIPILKSGYNHFI